MSSRVVYASPPLAAGARPPKDSRTFWLESLDRLTQIPLDGRPFLLRAGVQGLSKPPEDLSVSTVPGMDGAVIDGVQVLPRPVLLPLSVRADDQAGAHRALRRLRSLIRGSGILTPDGTCRLVCASPLGVRELTVAYVSGLEGEDLGIPNYDRLALSLLAVDPYARDRDARSIPFPLEQSAGPFLSNDPAYPWPRALSSTSVSGSGVPVAVQIVSDVPVRPRLDFVGPLDPLTVEASTGLYLSVPGGVPAGSTLTVVTDPRAKSIRMDGALAAGMVARGSRMGAPFLPGLNLLTVTAPGATEASKVVVAWRGAWESMW